MKSAARAGLVGMHVPYALAQGPELSLKLCCGHLEILDNFTLELVFLLGKSDGTMERGCEQRKKKSFIS